MKLNMKLSLLSVALLGLAACGSGGGAASNGNSKPEPASNGNINSTNLVKPNGAEKGISEQLKNEIKIEKKLRGAAYAIDDILATNSTFIILGTDFGERDIELDLFPKNQLVQENWSNTFDIGNEKWKEKGFWRLYNQVYSAVVADVETETIINGEKSQLDIPRIYEVDQVIGRNTSEKEMPKMGTAVYKGIAFDMTGKGNLVYTVDFGKKVGSGEIDGLSSYGKITLNKGSIGNLTAMSRYSEDFFKEHRQGVTGTAQAEKLPDSHKVVRYDLQFFGDKAQEIGGVVYQQSINMSSGKPSSEFLDAKVGFAGTKQ